MAEKQKNQGFGMTRSKTRPARLKYWQKTKIFYFQMDFNVCSCKHTHKNKNRVNKRGIKEDFCMTVNDREDRGLQESAPHI